MNTLDDILQEARLVSAASTLNSVTSAIERPLAQLGATHFLVCGLPMPSRAVDPLLIRIRWADVRSSLGTLLSIPAGDPIMARCRNFDAPFLLGAAEIPLESELVAATGYGKNARLIGIPNHSVAYYQGAIIAAGLQIEADEFTLAALDFLAKRVMTRLGELGYMAEGRPGELSLRERTVVALSAAGHTAQEIAEQLQISQRTIHAHLQNAADKLRASNKTQTVVEALRYGQLALRDIPTP